jgi:hypothetical protein
MDLGDDGGLAEAIVETSCTPWTNALAATPQRSPPFGAKWPHLRRFASATHSANQLRGSAILAPAGGSSIGLAFLLATMREPYILA